MSEHQAVFIHRSGPSVASYRYRAMIPAAAMGACLNGGEAGHVYIFSKPNPDDLNLAKECKAEGVKVVVDIGDDHFLNPIWGPIYKEIVGLADCIVTPTPAMSDRMHKQVGRHADTIIPDPYEADSHPPHADGPKMLWHGHRGNLKDLRPWLEFLPNEDLTILTNGAMGIDRPYLEWSPENQATALRETNLVLLPTRKGVEYKSANRLVNALRAGCFPVCSGHIPSYHEFQKMVWVGNFTTGVQWAKHFQKDLNALVAEGQTYIEKFSPASIGAQWRQVVETLCA